MTRLNIDRRDFPGYRPFSVALSADNDGDLLAAITPHAVGFHGITEAHEAGETLGEAKKEGETV